MTLTIDGRNMLSRAQAHDELKRALELPDYYGRNLDALWDLTSGMKADVKLIYASQMIGALGDYGNRLIATLENAAAFHPDFRFSTDLNDQDSPDDPSEMEPENDPLI